MARTINQLSVADIRSLHEPGFYSDGNGLYLQVRPGSKTWAFRFMINRRARTMGLGPVALVSLAKAREAALEARKLVRQGIDPIEHRKSQQSRPGVPTFAAAAEIYIESQRAGWGNAKHASQWSNTLTTYAGPAFGELPVSEVSIEHVVKALEPIWLKKRETASRVRGRIERVLDWAKTRGYREGENPARWSGHLEHSLPPHRRIQRVSHHPALPWTELPSFFETLGDQSGQAAKALQFTVLTAARTNETRGARWEEFDLDGEVPLWVIPGERMKAGRKHRVPLAEPIVKLIKELPRYDSGHLFEGRSGKPLSENAMLAVLKGMGRTDITVHGFRSTFRDWCAEQTAFPREIAEAALAHVNRDRVEAAYLRSDLFERRYQLMKAWAEFATSRPEENVLKLPLRAGSR